MTNSIALEQLLYPRSRMETLRCLLHIGNPISLRKLSEVSLVPLRSTQIAVRDLEQLGVVRIVSKNNTKLISVDNTQSEIFSFKSIIDTLERQKISDEKKRYAQYASKLLSELDDMSDFITTARKRIRK